MTYLEIFFARYFYEKKKNAYKLTIFIIFELFNQLEKEKLKLCKWMPCSTSSNQFCKESERYSEQSQEQSYINNIWTYINNHYVIIWIIL